MGHSGWQISWQNSPTDTDPHQFEPLLPSAARIEPLLAKAHDLSRLTTLLAGTRVPPELRCLLRNMNSYYTMTTRRSRSLHSDDWCMRAPTLALWAGSIRREAATCSCVSDWAYQLARSLIVGPHSQDTNDPFLGEYLIHNAVLNVDAARVSTSEVSN